MKAITTTMTMTTMTTIKWNNEQVGASWRPIPYRIRAPERIIHQPSTMDLPSVSERNSCIFRHLTYQLCAQVLGRFLALHRFRIAYWTSCHAPALAFSLHHHILWPFCGTPYSVNDCILHTHDFLSAVPFRSVYAYIHTYISIKSYFIPSQ
jgi:hypothetical protein